ncbi:hypothetical protein L2K70_02655 [Nocardioides KLBMP 9356]|uniref:Uncharacterized protein n=1 Tax=Nocardioides potassii TaxID=2911371 RepID=A0ABS9H8Y3_9ACTN|nr:hypothetical protein [Nocardioides potassii]MCF6376493.1 hypothetical protein [Nocardioides potassii]
MSDQQGTPRPDDETQPVRPEGAAAPLPEPPGTAPAATTSAPGEAPEPAPVARRGFRERFRTLRGTSGRDRTYGLAALIASALAGVIVGGLGLATFHAITHDGPGDRFDREGWVQRREDRGGPGFGGPGGGMHGGPPGMPGQVEPTTPPEEEDGSNS